MADLPGMTAHHGIMLCGHGSRDEGAVAEFENLAAIVRRRFPNHPVAHGFLEFAQPIIRDGLDKLRQAGAREILAVPGMLFAAGHAKNDIPSVLNRWQADHPGITVRYGRELGVDLKLLRAAGDRVLALLNPKVDGSCAHPRPNARSPAATTAATTTTIPAWTNSLTLTQIGSLRYESTAVVPRLRFATLMLYWTRF